MKSKSFFVETSARFDALAANIYAGTATQEEIEEFWAIAREPMPRSDNVTTVDFSQGEDS